jgi:Flp pilus assembly pilin Flp
MNFKFKLLRNQKGQGVMEYVILTGLVGIFCLAAVKKFGKSLDTRLGQIDKKIKKELIIK